MLLHKIILLSISVILAQEVYGQTLIMNEVSQGVSGNKEYVEFIVVDTSVTYSCTSTTPPCIDIRGWIFDDNSGYHGTVGIASGCVRFSYDPLWSCVPLGTVIVIYNDGDPNPQMPADDLSLTDNNCTVIAPIGNTSLFESNSTTPGDIACSYPATGWTPGGSWSNTLFANSGDCARIVDLSGCEVFSVCWTSANQNNLVYFGSGATSGSSATNTVYYFNNGDPNLSANWTIGCADVPACGQEDQTPGAPNNAANAAYIAQFNNGCQPITPIVSNAIVDANAGCTCTGQATASASGSIPGYTFEWYDASFTPIGQNSATATGLCGGTYHVIATSSIGCPDTSTVVITSSGATTVTVNSETICEGQSTTLTATPGTGGGTYAWVPGGFTTQSINVSPTTTTTYTVTYDLGGCTTNESGTVTVNPVYNNTENITICEGGSVTYPDGFTETISASTSHTSNLLSVDGCDSIIVTNVTMNPVYNLSENVSVCDGATITYPDGTNATITASTSYTSNLTTGAGCDSIIVTNVTMNPTYNLTENATVCDGASITYPDGTTATITANTSYTSNLTSAFGCDSIIVTNVTMVPTSNATENVQVCTGSNYTYPDGTVSNNITANESHVSTLTSVGGCDSIITTNISVIAGFNIVNDINLCSGLDYTYADGTTSLNITANESHVSNFVTATGCDSIITENILVGQTYNLTENVSVCDGATIIYPDGTNATITASTSYTSNLTTVAGCDSVIVTNVTMNPTYNLTENATVCDGASITYPDGTTATITANTSYTSNLTSAFGCDSIIVTNVTMVPTSNATENIQVCTGSNYTYPDGTVSNNITANESHVSTLTTVGGCDSIITTNISVIAGFNIVNDINLCSGLDYTYADGTTSLNITANESHVSNFVTATGCDSIITENILVGQTYNLTENVSVCDGATITYPDGTNATITASTSYTSNLTTIAGCDSIIVTNVTMNPTYNLTENATVCDGASITYPDGTTATITANTSYTSNLTSAFGCDSIIVTNVTMVATSNATENVQVCTGSNYTYPDGTVSNNITANESHVSILTSVSGCDSIVTTNVTVVTAYNIVSDINLCSGSNYTYADGTTSFNITANETYVSNFVTAAGCDSVVTENILVSPSYNLTENIAVCENDVVTYPDGTTETITANTSYTSNLTTVAGCDSIVVTNVTMNPGFQSTQDISVCENELVLYPDGTSETVVSSTTHTSVLTSSNGCDSIIVTNVSLIPNPIASFSMSQTNLTTFNSTVDFFNNSINANSYLWLFADSTVSNVFEPSYSFPNDAAGSYNTTLIAYNELGCSDTMTLSVEVEEELIFYVPNTFTPDNDEFNQVFMAVFTQGYDPFDFNMVIFDRWGEIIWESNDDSVGWDGTYAGIPVQDGTYTWRIEFKTTASDERVVAIGHVNVLR